MLTKLIGLSLLVHLTVIILAKIFNLIRGRKLESAFDTKKKKLSKTSKVANSVTSVLILAFVTVYMFSLMFIAIKTSLEVGANEPHVVFMKSLFGSFFGWIIGVLTHPTGVLILLVLVSVAIELNALRYRRQYSRSISRSI